MAPPKVDPDHELRVRADVAAMLRGMALAKAKRMLEEACHQSAECRQ
jgi:hypothetical protein